MIAVWQPLGNADYHSQIFNKFVANLNMFNWVQYKKVALN